MGTGFKGNSKYFRSIGQNQLVVANKYGMKNGYFGKNSIHGKLRTRNVFAEDNMATANDFYSKIAFGAFL